MKDTRLSKTRNSMSKTEYIHKLFTNRKSELELVGKKVTQGKSGVRIRGPLLNFWGVWGIGKSWLLHEIQWHYQYRGNGESPEEGNPRDTFAVYYDFVEVASRSISAVVKEMAQAILDQLPENLNEADALTAVAASGDARDFTTILELLTERYVPVLLFDTTEKLPTLFWREFEDELLEQLLSRSNMIVIIAGRRPAPRWKRAEVRRRATSQANGRVRPFNLKDMQKQFDALGYANPEELVDVVFDYTGGNPFLAERISHRLIKISEGETSEDVLPDEFNNILLNILNVYQTVTFEDVDLDLQEALDNVSVLRFYRTEALKAMLEDDRSDIELFRILDRLDAETETVWWDDAKSGYVTSFVMRQVMNQRLRLEKPAALVQKHEKALKLYKEWVENYPENSAIYLTEILYHQATVDRINQPQPTAITHFEEVIDVAKNLEMDRRMILPKNVHKDSELQRLLSSDLYEEVTRQLSKLLPEEQWGENGGLDNE